MSVAIHAAERSRVWAVPFVRWNYVLPDRAHAAKADALDRMLAVLTDHLRPRLQIQHAGFNRPEKGSLAIGLLPESFMRAPTRLLPSQPLDDGHICAPRPMHHRRTAHLDERSETPTQTLLGSSVETKIYFRDFQSKCRDSYFPFRAHRLAANHRFRLRMSLRLVHDTKSRFLMLE
jgi:hypothetical protein